MKRSVEKECKAVPSGYLKRVVDRIRGLAQQPRPSGCEEHSDEPNVIAFGKGVAIALSTALRS